MTDRDLSSPLTTVHRFTVKGDPHRFEREFREHSQYLRRRRDFSYLVTVRLLDSPASYVHVGHWRSLEGFIETVHTETFLEHVRCLEPMVDTEADQAVSVDRLLVRNARPGHDNVVLLSCTVLGEAREFEKEARELSRSLARTEGFGGFDLLRSTFRPQRYLGMVWWTDTAACDRALAGAERDGAYDGLTRVARLSVERTRHIAYERVLTG
ncbi:antibiotic biosynthesis monooxygenase family protein [Streptomyces radiopugnans]|uniref:antibiotic biosynthesis monooxygenase family protein n=1 Tax=Streptomyces radiopugnans TaxID=403935 RepID=UPI003F19DE20